MGSVINKVISEESLIRRKWLTVDQAAEKIVAFENRFGKDHLWLACHAAFPKILTPELINLIRINFFDQDDFLWIAEQDFLLSPLCRPVGDSLFEVEPRVREVLLVQLEDDFGRDRIRNLANFLLAYTESPLGGEQRVEINQLQRWIALAYISPDTLVEELTQNLLASVSTQGTGVFSLSSQIKIATAYELVADALERALAPEKYQGLAANARLMAYYWYGDRASLKQNVMETDADGETDRPDDTKQLTVFLDWVKHSPSDVPPPLSEELPLPVERSAWGKLEEERFDLSQYQLETIPELIKSYKAVAVVGAPGPARTEFLRLLAERLRPNFGMQLYINLQNDSRSEMIDAVEIQSDVIKKLRPHLEFSVDEEVVSATYKSVLSERPTLLVLDNMPLLEIAALTPPQGSFLITTLRRVGSSSSVYVVNFDGTSGQEQKASLSLADKIFLQDELLASPMMKNDLSRGMLLGFLPSELKQEISLDSPPYIFISQLIESLLNKYTSGFTELLDALVEQGSSPATEARLMELKEKVIITEAFTEYLQEQGRPEPRWPTLSTTPFVDRSEELETIRRILLTEHLERLIVIEGEFGIGKTALAWKALEDPEVRAAFPYGVIMWGREQPLYQGNRTLLAQIAYHLGLGNFEHINKAQSNDRVLMYLRQVLTQRRAIILIDEDLSAEDVDLIHKLSPPAVIYTTRAYKQINLDKLFPYRITLGPLPREAVMKFLQELVPQTDSLLPGLERFVEEAGGMPNQLPRFVEMLKTALDAKKDTADQSTSKVKPTRDRLFIGYSHKDKRWLDRLQTSLKPVIRSYEVSVWDDTTINAGSLWREEIEKVLASAKVAVLLVSPDFLVSDFIADNELLPLLEAAQKDGLTILWVAVSHSLHDATKIASYQAVNDPSKPLDSLRGPELDRTLARIVEKIDVALNDGGVAEANDLSDLEYRAGLNLVAVDINKLLSELVARRKKQKSGRTVLWRFERSDTPVHVRANRDVLQELFSHVMDNAVESIGGLSKPQIIISTKLKDNTISISIADNGHGIDASAGQMESLFQRWPSWRSKREGPSGLYISRSIARHYGGDVTLVSTGPSGTDFTINLPIHTEQFSQANILLVDDDLYLLDILKDFLERNSYKVFTASNVATAKRLIEGERIDLVIIDFRLRDKEDLNDRGGLDLAKDEAFRRVPIIIFTAFLDSRIAVEALRPQADGMPLAVDIIEKSDGLEQLLLAIKRELKKRISTSQPIQFYSCFLSYSSRDEDFAARLYSRLQEAGIRVWYAPEDIRAGERLYDQIDRAIQVHDKVLLVLSEASLRSEWVATEIRKARELELREKRRKLFPIRIVDYETISQWEHFDAETGRDLATEIREYFIPDFSRWKDHDSFETAFSRLLRDIKASELSIIKPPEGSIQQKRLENEDNQLQDDSQREHRMIGESKPMQEVYRFIARVAPSDMTVLIKGETGTGKELAARAIHRKSPRQGWPFVVINCAEFTETLFESELFGYEKGAFPGAIAQKKGVLERADGGTLFLDEVGEMSPLLQSKLLRVLQEREFKRVGGKRTHKVNIRVIAATNRNLEEAIKAGSFRQDLYFRLNVVSVKMPTLRERREDIPLLAKHFATYYAEEYKLRVTGLSPEAIEFLTNYEWPGNVRELRSVIARAVALGSAERIQPEDLSGFLIEHTLSTTQTTGKYYDSVKEAERSIILKALEKTGGSNTEAAKLLGIHPNNLHRLIRNLNLKVNSNSSAQLSESSNEVMPIITQGTQSYYDVIKEAKRDIILKALQQTKGNYTEAAKLLDIHPNNLRRLIRTMDLKLDSK